MKKGILILTILAVSIFLTHVKADTFIQEYGVNYTASGASTEGWSKFDYFVNTTKTTNMDFVYNQFTMNRNFDFSQYNGYMYMDFYIELPVVRQNINSTIEGNAYCDKWKWKTITTNEGVIEWECTHIDYGDTSTITDTEYITPKVYIYIIVFDRSGGFTPCTLESDKNKIKCPINNQSNNVTGIGIYSYVYYNSSNTYNYRVYLGRDWALYQNSDSAIINNQNQNTEKIMSELNQTAEYNETLNTNQKGANETVQAGQMEDQLINATDFNQSLLDGMTINTNASSFIWEIVERLRGMNIAIVTIFTSIMGMGILKLVLNR